ncbi:divergent polysaccharide deacetylase family protein [Aliiglaciecola litoralis]|uniref:Divergent polysaccharide deacetylase family protein n=1 Tax=Aliiglaciecola litoralis TaxID=582857 RepID=A0ABP3WZM6_9ALTE
MTVSSIKYLVNKAFVLLFTVLSLCVHSAEIALIIDDMGNTSRDAAAFELPTQVAFSILPMTHLSKRYSRQAALQQREVMLHIPMESLAGNQLGPGAITSDMSPQSIRLTLLEALASVPDAIGVNNHMGSKLTQLSVPMEVTMQFLIEHNLFFVDSRTTRFSKAQRIAQDSGVMSLKRNVFLDHDATPEQIDAQFQRLLRLAKKYGYAVGIAHPYPQTVKYLRQALHNIEEQGVQLATVSELVELQQLTLNQNMSQNTGAIALD